MFVVPSLTWDRARNLHSDPAFHANVAGSIYAQPLYWHPRGSNKALLLVATEQNVVYATKASAKLFETFHRAPKVVADPARST